MLSSEYLLLVQQALMQVRQRWPDARLEANGVPGAPPILVATEDGQPCWIPYLPGPLKSYPVLQEARRAVNVWAVGHSKLPPSFGPQPQERDLPSPYAAPARILFETHELRRIPVDADARAQAFLESGNEQTRLLRLALSEAFGHLASVERVTIAWVEPAAVDVPCLLVTASTASPQGEHGWHLRTDDLLLRTPTTEVAFKAHEAAAELVRQYRARQHT